MACSRHPQEQIGFVCVHKPCHRKFQLICCKCRSDEHSNHISKILPIAEFMRNMNRLEKEILREEDECKSNLRIYQKLRMVGEFHQKISQLQKKVMKIWIELVSYDVNIKNSRKGLQQNISKCVAQMKSESYCNSQVNQNLKEMSTLLEYNLNRSKLSYIKPEINNKQLKNKQLLKELKQNQLSIKQYLVKIIEVFLQAEEELQPQSEIVLLERFLEDQLKKHSEQESSIQQNKNEIISYFAHLFPEKSIKINLISQGENQQLQQIRTLNIDLEKQLKDLIEQKQQENRLKGVMSKQNKTLKQQIKKLKQEIKTKIEQNDQRQLTKEKQFSKLQIQYKNVLQKLNDLNFANQRQMSENQLRRQEIEKLKQENNVLVGQKMTSLTEHQNQVKKMPELQLMLSQVQKQFNELSQTHKNSTNLIAQLKIRIKQQQILLNQSDITTKNLTQMKNSMNMKIISLEETINQLNRNLIRQKGLKHSINNQNIPTLQTKQCLMSQIDNIVLLKQKQPNQTQMKIIYKLLNKVIADMNTLEAKVKEHQAAEKIHEKQLANQKVLVSKLKQEISQKKKKPASLNRTKSQLLILHMGKKP